MNLNCLVATVIPSILTYLFIATFIGLMIYGAGYALFMLGTIGFYVSWDCWKKSKKDFLLWGALIIFVCGYLFYFINNDLNINIMKITEFTLRCKQ